MNEDSIDDLITKAKMAVVLLDTVTEECLKLQKKKFGDVAYWAWIHADRARDDGNYCVGYLENYKEEAEK